MGTKQNTNTLAAALLGRLGGLARKRKLSPEARSASARKAALARWAKTPTKPPGKGPCTG